MNGIATANQKRWGPRTAIVSASSGVGPPATAPALDVVMARADTENFPVASRILSASTRRHLAHIYGFARLTDQLGDAADGDRLALLDWLDREVDVVFAGGRPAHPVMQRLIPTVRRWAIPEEPLRRLIDANRQDQHVRHYATFDQLAAYCELSANPVGRLVLHVFGAATPERIGLSDCICTALQLAEHWQDVAEDYDAGRVYLPKEDLERFGYDPAGIGARVADASFRTLMAFETERALAIMAAGAPLMRLLPRRQAIAVGAFVEGGRAALRAIARADYDVLTRAPRPNRWDKISIGLRLFRLGLAW